LRETIKLVISIIDTIKVEGNEGKVQRGKIRGTASRSTQIHRTDRTSFKTLSPAIEYLKKAITYEPKEKKDLEAHLWLAQSYALSSGNTQFPADEGQASNRRR